MDEFDSRRNGCEVFALKFEGGNVDLRKALAFYDIGDDNLVDATEDRGEADNGEEQRHRQLSTAVSSAV